MLRPRTTPDLIADALREDIASGRIPLGAPLRQEELAARFAVSRIPVREALRRLESEELVTVLPNRGAYVATLSAEEIREIMDMRVLIEGDLVLRAVPACTLEDLDRLAFALRIGEREASARGWSDADHGFHEALYAPAGRPRQSALAMSLRRSVERYAIAHRRLPERREDWLEDHRALLETYRHGDAEAAHARITEHIRRAGAFLIDHVIRGTA